MISQQEEEEGREAARLLADPAFIRTCKRLDEGWIAVWRSCSDPAERDMLWSKIAALEELQGSLRAAAAIFDAAEQNRVRLANKRK